VAIPAVSIGLIYLIIVSFFSVGFFTPRQVTFLLPRNTNHQSRLRFAHFVAWRYLSTLTIYFFLSLSYSLVSLAFQVPFSRSPQHDRHAWSTSDVMNNANYGGQATFPVYWMLNFMGMTALGLACENAVMFLEEPWTALWLLFWAITNASTAFYALELAPRFYGWGYFWPLRQVVYASRTLLFGTRDRLAFNLGILIVWVAVGTIVFPVACWFKNWKTQKRNLVAFSGDKSLLNVKDRKMEPPSHGLGLTSIC
jgi:hypothetical protein